MNKQAANSLKTPEEPMGYVIMFDDSEASPRRTKASHPYSYDPIVQYVARTSLPETGCCYSDRLKGWYPANTLSALQQKHFKNDGDYFSQRSPAAIERFLRELMGKPELVLLRVEEHCNQATGFPVWFFVYHEPTSNPV